MTELPVVFRPLAEDDLIGLYRYIAERSGPSVALGFVERLERACLAMATFPERGTRRDDIRTGLRTLGFERRVTVAFEVAAHEVVIVRLLYAGRDLDTVFDPPGPTAG